MREAARTIVALLGELGLTPWAMTRARAATTSSSRCSAAPVTTPCAQFSRDVAELAAAGQPRHVHDRAAQGQARGPDPDRLHAQRLRPHLGRAVLGPGPSRRSGGDAAAPRRALRAEQRRRSDGRWPRCPSGSSATATRGRSSPPRRRASAPPAAASTRPGRRWPAAILDRVSELIEEAAEAPPAAAPRRPPALRAPAAGTERRTTPVELLWDLVFVFAITQVTTLLSSDPSWTRFGESMLVLALVWWAWSAFVWAANAQETDSPALRLEPAAGDGRSSSSPGSRSRTPSRPSRPCSRSATRSCASCTSALYVDASRRGNAAWSAIAGFAVTVAIGMALLIGGSLRRRRRRGRCCGRPRWRSTTPGRRGSRASGCAGLQEVAVAHFAERYSLFVIICLGESIVAIGLGATRQHLDAALIAAVGFGRRGARVVGRRGDDQARGRFG